MLQLILFSYRTQICSRTAAITALVVASVLDNVLFVGL